MTTTIMTMYDQSPTPVRPTAEQLDMRELGKLHKWNDAQPGVWGSYHSAVEERAMSLSRMSVLYTIWIHSRSRH